jgi:hypothetical protein
MVVRIRAVGDRQIYYRANGSVRQEAANASTTLGLYFPVDCSFSTFAADGRSACRASSSADSEGFQLPVERRTLHADELRRPRYIAAEPGNLRQEIFPFEDLAGFAEG